MKRMKLLFTLALPVVLCQNAQGQTQSRLVAEAHLAHNGAMFKQMDSSSYIFASNARGGDLMKTHKYDNATNWNYVNDSAYVNNTMYSQEFDANNNVTSRTMQFWNGTAWVLSTRTSYTYNALNNMTSKIEQTWGGASWVPVSKNVYTYDANNLVLLDQYMTWNSLTSTFDPYSQKTFVYDPISKKVLNQTDQDVFGGSPVYTGQTAYTYTSANQLLTETHSIWSSGWVNSTMYTYAYDTSGNRITRLYQTWDVPTSAWMNVSYDIYSNFTASHMAQSHINQMWNSTGSGTWVNTMQYMYTYNSFDQRTSSIGQSWNIVGMFQYALGDPMARYYYGTFSDVNSIRTLASKNGVASIYPVPAQSTMNVDINWENAQPTTIAIFDMTGRQVSQTVNVAAAKEAHATISVSDLTSGTYVMQINGAEGKISKQFVVAK